MQRKYILKGSLITGLICFLSINSCLAQNQIERNLMLSPAKKAILQRAAVNAETEKLNASKTAEQKPGVEKIISDYWVQFLALIVSVFGLILAASGFSMANSKKQKNLKKYFHEIDDVYASFKWKSKRCEAELYRLQDLIEEQLKEGKIDESTYQLLEGRIKKYLDEIKYAEERPITSDAQKVENGKKLEEQIDKVVEEQK